MTAVRLVFYIVDPFTDRRLTLAALIAADERVVVVRAPLRDVPKAARANVERILRDLEAAAELDPLPLGVGAQAVGGAVLWAAVPPEQAPAWIRAGLFSTSPRAVGTAQL